MSLLSNNNQYFKYWLFIFPLVFFLPRPLFSPRPIDKLPEWAFRLASLLLHPHRGFFCSLSSSHAHFYPRNLATSFQFVFSRLLFFLKTHDMCFFSYLSSQKHTFLPGTQQLASGLCFSACFSS